MEKPIDLKQLREITDGDKALEAELFRVFIISAMQCIRSLHAAAANNDDKAWRKQAHALKGISANLGAQPLTNICARAQDNSCAVPEEKKNMMAEIESEFLRVREIIDI
jgi:HPt (histidine-containing phosphotransfer) domain-containing protein